MYTIKEQPTVNEQITSKVIIKQNEDGSVVSFGEWPDNTDYQQYLKWLDEGNTPLPADEQGAA